MTDQIPLLEEIGDPTARHEDDFYATPKYQSRALLNRLSLRPGWRVLEPCAGDGAIVRELPHVVDVVTNDIVQRDPMVPDFLLDATLTTTWENFEAAGPLDIVLTNPPFDVAFHIAQHAIEHARVALILLLRLSWFEPTEERGPWLRKYPPTSLIVLPRYDYRRNGKTDSVTSCWAVWARVPRLVVPGIDFVTWSERDELIAQERLGR